LSVVGIVAATRWRKPRSELPLIWFVVGWVLLYVPFAQQRRLSVGLQVPLCLWAAVGLVQGVQPFVQRCLAQRWNEWLVRSSLAALVFSTSLTNVFLLAAGIFAGLMHQEPSFVLYPESQALHWLDKHTAPSDVVLCGHRMGSLIPAWTSSRVFVGHWAETPDLEGKLVLLSTFFDPDIPERTREKMIETYGITYLFYGADERTLGLYRPSDDPHWTLAFADEQVSVFRWRAR
jgi:hypothetical protein